MSAINEMLFNTCALFLQERLGTRVRRNSARTPTPNLLYARNPAEYIYFMDYYISLDNIFILGSDSVLSVIPGEPRKSHSRGIVVIIDIATQTFRLFSQSPAEHELNTIRRRA